MFVVEDEIDSRAGTIRLGRDGDDTVLMWSARDPRPSWVEVVRYDPHEQLLRIFPQPESRVREIQIDRSGRGWSPSIGEDDFGQLELGPLPEGMGSRFVYGLRPRRRYSGLISEIEQRTSCTVVRFGDGVTEGLRGDVFHMSLRRHVDFVARVDLNHRRGTDVVRKVVDADALNSIGEIFGEPEVVPSLGRKEVIKVMTRGVLGDTNLNGSELKTLVEQLSSQSGAAARRAPVAFGKLRKDVELVSLDVLVEQFEQALASRDSVESVWQEFFQDNTFALQQLFATPVVLFGTQVHVRSPGTSGRGTRIADFLFSDTATSNAIVVEIKKPSTPLLGGVYRGKEAAEVYAPHSELVGAVAQVQAQAESVRSDLRRILADERRPDELRTGAVRVAVIAGTASSMNAEQAESFARYRHGLAGVDVIAFDEVRDRLIGLRDFLADPPASDAPMRAVG